VQWQTLASKYEERHRTKLDFQSLGHTSALAAASALLFDVVRIVDASDTDNPVLAIEDSIALIPQVGSLATWPSLYKAMCDITRNHGTLDKDPSSGNFSHTILLSQVKPLLTRYWDSNFEDRDMKYFTEEGSTIKLKKLKHLGNALLRWRAERIASRVATKASTNNAVDAIVAVPLELEPSPAHNDLLLRCSSCEVAQIPLAENSLKMKADACKPALKMPARKGQDAALIADSSSMSSSWPTTPRSQNSSCVSPGPEESLLQEIERLRSENANLRSKNSALEHNVSANPIPQQQSFNASYFEPHGKLQPTVSLDNEFDDPFEPPPEMRSMWAPSPVASTSASSGFGFGSGTATPTSDLSQSGCNTPGPSQNSGAKIGQFANNMALVPVWFSMGDRLQIPCGVVQQARIVFERHAAIPSFFAQQTQ
jgi:hypothetical protein